MLISRDFVVGAWRDADGSDRVEVVCPNTEEVIGYCAKTSEQAVDAAVSCARKSFDYDPWPRMSVEQRAAVVVQAMSALAERADEVGRLVTAEMGAPVSVSVPTVRRVSETAAYFADVARSTATVERRNDGIPAAIVREPVGVAAAIAPWNGPVPMALVKILRALLAGCTVVFNAAPETPFDVSYLVDAVAAEGLPLGVLNIVSGGAETGAALVRHPGVDEVSFTGSTGAGRQIAEVCGPQFKRTQLELGGKSAAIILDDADFDEVVAGLSRGCFHNSGQVCAALSRVLAPPRTIRRGGRCSHPRRQAVGDRRPLR